jgi:hypothetical protein
MSLIFLFLRSLKFVCYPDVGLLCYPIVHRILYIAEMKRYFTRFTIRFSVLLLISVSASAGLYAQQPVTKDLPQYFLSDFAPAEIIMKEGNILTLDLNYNTATGKMVFIKDGKLYDLTNPRSVDTVYIRQYVFIPSEQVFLDIVADGSITFFIQHKSDISLNSKPAMTGTTQVSVSNAYYIDDNFKNVNLNLKLPENITVNPSDIFWVRVNERLEKYTNVKQFLKIFPGNAGLIKAFIKKSDLKLADRSDLIKLANYCNSIVK